MLLSSDLRLQSAADLTCSVFLVCVRFWCVEYVYTRCTYVLVLLDFHSGWFGIAGTNSAYNTGGEKVTNTEGVGGTPPFLPYAQSPRVQIAKIGPPSRCAGPPLLVQIAKKGPTLRYAGPTWHQNGPYLTNWKQNKVGRQDEGQTWGVTPPTFPNGAPL